MTPYRQGEMNIVVNAHGGVVKSSTAVGAPGHDGAPRLSALALRVRDARAAYTRAPR